ncbi:uncharacterized protein LOC113769146 [Coffea eugenioides]|uniref:uncharacterized protein LOC113769146 n=1 Tax=Coffea eugenioides TaxID=49369 RepID=UPI000F60C881|nr:uncharacterized protein LOC113769146 [Coffea eugenioides]
MPTPLPSLIILPKIPAEVIQVILARLPVKSILKLQCVYKSWLSLISSPAFMRIHLDRSSSTDNQRLLVSKWFDSKEHLKHCRIKSLLCNEDATDAVLSSIDCPLLEHHHKQFINKAILGYCDGLEVWVMKDYGIRESWSKKFCIPRNRSPRHMVSKLACLLEDNEVLVICGSNLAFYNVKDNFFRDVLFRTFDACVYVESLISPPANNGFERHQLQGRLKNKDEIIGC